MTTFSGFSNFDSQKGSATFTLKLTKRDKPQ